MSLRQNMLGTLLTTSGINPLAIGVVDVNGSNTTISNALVTTSSCILVTPICPIGGLSGVPQITTRSAGSFIVNVPGYVANMKLSYFIAGNTA